MAVATSGRRTPFTAWPVFRAAFYRAARYSRFLYLVGRELAASRRSVAKESGRTVRPLGPRRSHRHRMTSEECEKEKRKKLRQERPMAVLCGVASSTLRSDFMTSTTREHFTVDLRALS